MGFIGLLFKEPTLTSKEVQLKNSIDKSMDQFKLLGKSLGQSSGFLKDSESVDQHSPSFRSRSSSQKSDFTFEEETPKETPTFQETTKQIPASQDSQETIKQIPASQDPQETIKQIPASQDSQETIKQIPASQAESHQTKEPVTSHTSQVEQIKSKETNQPESIPTSQQTSEDYQKLNQAFEKLREETESKMKEYDDLKHGLLQELENRTQKFLEMESLVEEARELYANQIMQVKHSSSNNPQQQCLLLQRKLEHMTQVNEEIVEKYNRLQLDNQVHLKQIVLRNERINGLELLLQHATDQIQTLADQAPSSKKIGASPTNPAIKSNRRLSSQTKSTIANPPALSGGKIARPIRGGGSTASSTSPKTEGDKKGFFSFF